MPSAPGNESLSEGRIIQPASSGQLARRRVATFSNERLQRMCREEDREYPRKNRGEKFAAAAIETDCADATYSLKQSYGWEAQLYRGESFYMSRRFDLREMAISWANTERADIEKGGRNEHRT